MIVRPIRKRILGVLVLLLWSRRWEAGGTNIAHCKPLKLLLAELLGRRRRTYIALSKNKITPPIRKNPPGRSQLARSNAPKHIGSPHTHHLSRMLHQSL